MIHATHRKAGLFLGCAGAAIAVSLAAAPQRAAAQAFQATPTVVQGSATIDRAVPSQDTITVDTMDTVIDWVPDEISGTALDFLPTGATAIFQNNGSNPDFGVLNRILPSTNGDIVVMDGAVISQLQTGAGTVPGGNVAFYSPTGILVGSNATFDVGRLVLTSISPDIAQIGSFWGGGSPLTFTGTTGDLSSIQISPGASITAGPDGSFLIVAAPQIFMDGSVSVNGSTAYVAGEQVVMTYNGGLFDISVPVGSSVGGPVIVHTGTTTGPASTGVGDNQVIYGVTRSAANPVSMLFSGNLGFQPAITAGVENGDIILAANYDVAGRTVANDTITNGIGAIFDGDNATSITQADIFVDSITASSDLLAISTHTTQVNASASDSLFAGDLLIVGRQQAILNSNVGFVTDIQGDVVVSASDRASTGSGNGGTDPNAVAGSAFIDPVGGTVNIAGSVRVEANATAGTDTDISAFGTATAGSAQIYATGGTVSVGGFAIVNAAATQSGGAINSGGAVTGGFARIGAQDGGSVSVDSATLNATATGGNVSAGGVSGGIDATGGTALINVPSNGGSVTVTNGASLDASAYGGAGNATGPGGAALGGTAIVNAQAVGSTINIGTFVTTTADAVGGQNSGGTGGSAIGGNAQAAVQGGQLTVGGSVTASANATGGAGIDGGAAAAGISGVFAGIGTLAITGNASATAVAIGGDASLGLGGTGGAAQGGNAFVQANGTLVDNATITIGGDALVSANAQGGMGGSGDGSTITPGAGGEARAGIVSTPNAFDPNFGGGAYILAQGDRGFLTVTGTSTATAIGAGGQGGTAGTGQNGGQGGDAYGGTAQVGSLIGAGDGSVALGVVTLANASADASAFGGTGGFDEFIELTIGDGGDGISGNAFLTSRVGTVTAGQLTLTASGTGGVGGNGGDGTGGLAGLLGVASGTANVASYSSEAIGEGGAGIVLAGGTGQGGSSYIGFQGGTVNVAGDVTLDAAGIGGSSFGADGGAGIGGEADIANFTAEIGSGSVGGLALVQAHGIGGDTFQIGATGGSGTGGQAYLMTQVGGTLTVNSARVVASGQGGSGPDAIGGLGTGGEAYIEANGTGSTITVTTDAPPIGFDPLAINATVGAMGLGGRTTHVSGVGGTGQGGTARVEALGGAISLGGTGLGRILARGIGGLTTIDGGTGGTGIGGIVTAGADAGGSLTSSDMHLSAFGQGGAGDGTITGLNANGGTGIGGAREIYATNGATITLSASAGISGGIGGEGLGTGNGGDAIGGVASLLVDNATANLVGRTIVVDQPFGGGGVIGGSATPGSANVVVANGGVLTVTAGASTPAELVVSASAFGGLGTTGAGGDAVSGDTLLVVTDGQITADSLIVQADGRGGGSTNGAGGSGTAASAQVLLQNGTVTTSQGITVTAQGYGGGSDTGNAGSATGGSATFQSLTSTINAGALQLQGGATGGASSSGAAGDATSGIASLTVSGGLLSVTGNTVVNTVASGGIAPDGPAGNAIGGNSSVSVDGGANLSLNLLDINANADANDVGGDATGGDSGLFVADGSVTIAQLVQSVNATSNGGTAIGGTANLFLQPVTTGGGTVDVTQAFYEANAVGGVTNTAGQFDLSSRNAGAIIFQQLGASATGIDAIGVSSFLADGGDFLITGSAAITASERIEFETANGGSIIGGSSPLDLSAVITVDSGTSIGILGDDDNRPSFGALTMTLSAPDIDIPLGARFGAVDLTLVSTNTGAPALLGGTVDGPGYTLTQDEAVRIEAGSVTFIAPALSSDPLRAPDVEISDLVISGSLDDGPSFVSVDTPGIVAITGLLNYTNAGPGDTLQILAGEQIQIHTASPTAPVTDLDGFPVSGAGQIYMNDADGEIGGNLSLFAPSIVAAEPDLIAQIISDPQAAGLANLLADTGGRTEPTVTIAANSVFLSGESYIYFQNVGTSTLPSAIAVGSVPSSPTGSGNLVLIQSDDAQVGPMDAIVFALQVNPDGSFLSGNDFFPLAQFNTQPSNHFTSTSTLNGCFIVTGTCGGSLPPTEGGLIDEAPPINNPAVIEDPVAGEPTEPTEEEGDSEFGMDFPGLLDAPTITEDGVVDDPVTSGGDSALYASDDDGDDQDDDEVEDEGEGDDDGE